MTRALDGLNDAELRQVAEYVDFLNFRAHRTTTLSDTELAALYAEFADEDRALAEGGIAEYMDTPPEFSTPLVPAKVAALLRSSLAILSAEVTALDPGALAWRPAPDGWCINEIIGHLIEAEQRGFAGRIRHILEADYPTFATWDQPAVARARRDCERDGAVLLHEFTTLRTESIALVERLQPSDVARAGYHPVVGELTVQDLLHEWVFHDRNHLQQLGDVVKALMWPHMGNSRRFSAPQPAS